MRFILTENQRKKCKWWMKRTIIPKWKKTILVFINLNFSLEPAVKQKFTQLWAIEHEFDRKVRVIGDTLCAMLPKIRSNERKTTFASREENVKIEYTIDGGAISYGSTSSGSTSQISMIQDSTNQGPINLSGGVFVSLMFLVVYFHFVIF